jgi:peroxiredoxin
MNNQALLLSVLTTEGVILMGLCALFYQLLKQHGRILLRVDRLEHNARPGFVASAEDSGPTGLSVGTQFPAFRYFDLAGKVVELTDVVGKRTLIVHWSTGCSVCMEMARDLALFEDAFAKAKAQLILLSSDDATALRKYSRQLGLKSPILLGKDGTEALELFSDFGTPAPYLLDERGRVAHPLVVGSDGTLSLAREMVAGTGRRSLPGERSLAESRIERNGLKAGTAAPAFVLPDLSGRTVSLKDYRGRRLLLVFTDPHCGPCDRIAAGLARFHQQLQANGLALVMVGRGDAGENRKKAKQNRFDFPVVLQKQWELSKQYGIFATPVAFLISEEGIIAKDVAIGPDAILELAQRLLNHESQLEEPILS